MVFRNRMMMPAYYIYHALNTTIDSDARFGNPVLSDRIVGRWWNALYRLSTTSRKKPVRG